jgi:hypothetical protein
MILFYFKINPYLNIYHGRLKAFCYYRSMFVFYNGYDNFFVQLKGLWSVIICLFFQTLDTVYVGPVPEGRHMFVFQVGELF